MVKLSRFFILISLVAAIFTLPRWILAQHYAESISEPEDAPEGSVAIVFGAGLRRDGRPTAVLADRVQTAAQLYLDGKIEKLLLSGSTRQDGYDETVAMRDYAMGLGVSQDALMLDPGGDRTYLTCLHARDHFGIDHAILVSQRYHLPRALALCETLGIQSEGVASDLRTYRAQSFWTFRESLATLRALWDAGKYQLGRVFTAPTQPIS